MASASIPKDRRTARIAIVERHIRMENEHDLEGVLRTFGDTARYDDEAWGEHYLGRNRVRLFYEQLMKALPDLEIYYDRGTVLRQLGVFHEPQRALGQICIFATHPVTIARAFARKLLRR